MRRAVCAVAAAALVLACDDGDVAPGGSTDVTATLDASRSVTASEVIVEPRLPSIPEAEHVQSALEQIATGLLALAGRVTVLEDTPTPTTPEPPTARDIAFDPSKTHAQATNVQTLGEALDLTTQLLTADVEVAASKAELAAIAAGDLEVSLGKLELGVSALEAAVTKELADHAWEIEGLVYVADMVQFADGIALEKPGTLIDDYVFPPNLIAGPETVYSGIKYLAQRVSVHDALFESPCPPEMFNKAGAYCVDKSRNPSTDSWRWQAQYCRAQGKRLCGPAELFAACFDGGISPSDKAPGGGFGVDEFMDQLSPDGKALALTGKDCDEVKTYFIHAGDAYARCCKDINPTAAK